VDLGPERCEARLPEADERPEHLPAHLRGGRPDLVKNGRHRHIESASPRGRELGASAASTSPPNHVAGDLGEASRWLLDCHASSTAASQVGCADELCGDCLQSQRRAREDGGRDEGTHDIRHVQEEAERNGRRGRGGNTQQRTE